MRITQIRSFKDFGWYGVDQIAHAAIVLAPTVWLARSPGDVAIAGAIILTIREVEQGRRTVKEWREVRRLGGVIDADAIAIEVDWLDLLVDLHLPDRILDIAWGALLASGAFWLYT